MGKLTAHFPDSNEGQSPELTETNSDDNVQGNFAERWTYPSN